MTDYFTHTTKNTYSLDWKKGEVNDYFLSLCSGNQAIANDLKKQIGIFGTNYSPKNFFVWWRQRQKLLIKYA